MTAAVIYDAWKDYNPTVPISGLPAIHRLTATFFLAGVNRVAVISTENTNDIERYCTKIGADFLRLNKREKRSIENCVLAGLSFYREKTGRICFVPSFLPFIDVPTIKTILDNGADIVYPVHQGKRGFPALVNKTMYSTLDELGGNLNLLIEQHVESAACCETSDAGVTADVRVIEEPEVLTNKVFIHGLRPTARISVARELGFFGKGTLQLLRLTEETGSLNKACKLMGIAYSRAWTLIQNIEKNLGFKALDTHIGGRKDKKWSKLTKECREFIDKYESFTADCVSYINESFKNYFNGE